MGFTCGIVGLPNIGKTTIFNALTQAGAEVTNYAFSSSKPNLGVAQVPDERLDTICKLVPADNKVPTTLEFVDLAGLVKGSSQGEGLGNSFLGSIREVDAIAHVVRCYASADLGESESDLDPVSDIEVVNTELMIADMETLEKRKYKLAKLAKSGDAEARRQIEIIDLLLDTLSDNKMAREAIFENEADSKFVKSLTLLTSIPVFYICNIADPADAEKDYIQKVKEFGEKENSPTVALAGSLENEILEFTDPEEKQVFMEEMGLKETGLDQVIQAGYNLLELVTFFTVGGTENRAWTIRANYTAPQAAGKIHTDFEKGFIRAEVFNYDDLVKYKTEQAVKEAGLMRLEGKEYIVKDGDILHFRFNV